MNKDYKHSKMISYFLKEKKELDAQNKEKRKYQTEVHYNHYGTRGYIDVIEQEKTKRNPNKFFLWIYEMKTTIDDLGQMIRQLKTAQEVIEKDPDVSFAVICPVILLKDNNIKIIMENLEYIESAEIGGVYFLDYEEELLFYSQIDTLKEYVRLSKKGRYELKVQSFLSYIHFFLVNSQK